LRPSVANQSKKSSAKVGIKMTKETKVKVQLVRSPIGTQESHRATVRGLGLRGINSISELQDTPAVRGMINKISYLVKVI
jgi:large subunit ribosomal protein L30